MTRSWDATTYHRVSAPQLEWAGKVLERLPLRGDETVLDAGCGSGRVTEQLADRLPRGRVIALDASPSMIACTLLPRSSSGSPMTTHECTAGCSCSAASISAG